MELSPSWEGANCAATQEIPSILWNPLSREDGSLIYSCCWPLPVQSFSGPSPTELMSIVYSLRFKTPPTQRATSPYLYPAGTGWPSYTPRHWVPFSLPPMTRRAKVEVFNPASTTELLVLVAQTTQKTSLPLLCVPSLPGKCVHRALP
jgi:hypothetical protein